METFFVPCITINKSSTLENMCHAFFLRFYLPIHERHTQRERERQREKQAPCREPDAGLHPKTPGSHPGLKEALDC